MVNNTASNVTNGDEGEEIEDVGNNQQNTQPSSVWASVKIVDIAVVILLLLINFLGLLFRRE